MSGNFPDILPLLRERLRARVRSTSLRSVAREVGMSPTGLQQLIDGADPYTPTVGKLLAWWAKHAYKDTGAAEARRLGVELATRDLPPALGSRTADLLLKVLDGVTPERLDALESALRRHEGVNPATDGE